MGSRSATAEAGSGQADPPSAASILAEHDLERAAAVLLAHHDARIRAIGRRLHAELVDQVDPARRLLEEKLTRRNSLVREAAASFGSGLAVAEQARLLSKMLARYAATTWARDRVKPANPYPPATLNSYLYDIMSARPRALCPRQLQRIIRTFRDPGEMSREGS